MINSRSSAQTIPVTGATGNIGSELVEQLAGHGESRVRAVTRDPAAAVLSEGVEPVQADLRHADSLRPALTCPPSIPPISPPWHGWC